MTMPVYSKRIENAYSESIVLVLSGEPHDGTVAKVRKECRVSITRSTLSRRVILLRQIEKTRRRKPGRQLALPQIREQKIADVCVYFVNEEYS